jgi:kynurenine formamidase
MRLFLENGDYIDTEYFHDLSLPLTNSSDNPRAWYVDQPSFEPVRANGFIGSVIEGGSVNFRNIFFNPHGHGTHTECLGHITKEVHSVNRVLDTYFSKALVITVDPESRMNGNDGKMDAVILPEMIDGPLKDAEVEALIIRTMPNDESKKHKNYSSQNPAYLHLDCIHIINEKKVRHLLIDTPSVDREEDGGELAFHHAFWNISQGGDFKRTITEMVYVPDHVRDGVYMLELQMAPFENDASPSRPVLYPISRK